MSIGCKTFESMIWRAISILLNSFCEIERPLRESMKEFCLSMEFKEYEQVVFRLRQYSESQNVETKMEN